MKSSEKETSDLMIFSNEIAEFLMKMQNMDNSDEIALTQNLNEEYYENNFFMTENTPNDNVKGLDPKQFQFSEDILDDFIDVLELLGEEEKKMFNEYKKAETLLDERYVLRSKQLLEVINFKKLLNFNKLLVFS